MTVQADDPISFMQLTAKNEMTSKEDQFQLSLLAAMGNTQRKEAADPLASKLNKVNSELCRTALYEWHVFKLFYIYFYVVTFLLFFAAYGLVTKKMFCCFI